VRFVLWAGLLGSGCSCDQVPCFERHGDPTLAQIQSQIFDRSCNKFSSCHNPYGMGDAAELNLCGPKSPYHYCSGTDTTVHDRIVNVSATCRPGSRSVEDPTCVPEDADAGPPSILVVPGDPDSSYLYRRISGDVPDGVRCMPYGTTDCLCAQGQDAIRTWIEDGALDD
jgi:hypothetical protein